MSWTGVREETFRSSSSSAQCFSVPNTMEAPYRFLLTLHNDFAWALGCLLGPIGFCYTEICK